MGKCRLDVVCPGAGWDMGVAQGAALATNVRGAYEALRRLEAMRLLQPRWLPFGLFRSLAARKAAAILSAPLRRDYPACNERLRGIAHGAGVSLAAAYLLNGLEPMLSSVASITDVPPLGGCSAVAIRGRRSQTGEPVIARNFDYLPLVQPFYMLRESRPNGGWRSLDFTTAPLAGAVDGVNERGLCVTYDYAFTTDQPATAAAPISMLIAETLAQCATVAEAIDRIATRPRWGGGLLMLADESGDLASVEVSSTRRHVRRPAAGEDAIFHTNAFASATMRACQVADAAVYSRRAPAPLRGRRLHESSEVRDGRFRELLAHFDRLGDEELRRLMGDHGPDERPGDYTPCVHGSYWHTTATMRLYPRSRRMSVSYSTACAAQFADFTL